mgnify:CR=1 FL=1
MIVEFLGVSGVGKTTIAKKYFEDQLKTGRMVWSSHTIYSNTGWFKRNIKKAVHVITFSVMHFNWVIRLLNYLRKNLRIDDIFKMLFNCIYLRYTQLKTLKKYEIIIFDEGIIQYYWAIHLRNDKEISTEDFREFSRLYNLPDYLYFIDAEEKIIAERLLNRGEYTKILDSKNLTHRILEMQNVERKIINILPKSIKIKEICNN